MTRRHSRRCQVHFRAAAGLLTLAVAAGAPAAAGTAEQPDLFLKQKVLGPLGIEPVSGDFDTNIFVTTAGGCPRGTNTLTRLYGPKLSVDGENVIGNSEVLEFGSPPADRMRVPLTINLAEVARRQVPSVILDGTYTLNFNCQTPLPVTLKELYGRYVGTLVIKDGRYTARTTISDLPKVPKPKAGSDALEAFARSGPAPAEDPQLVLEGSPPQASTLASSQTGEDRGITRATILVAAGVLAAGLGAFAVYRRRPRPHPSGETR
ncbi:MAG: hypothetical protein ACT4PP_16410 [Sporichthyaceae bacterium]